MAADSNHYDHRGGGNYGVVLCVPRVVADERLVYFDHNKNRGSWVIRDFVAGQKLDDNHSALTGAQIEADALYDEFQFGATRRRIRLTGESYLNLRTTAVFRLRGPLRSPIGPNPQSGVWQAMERGISPDKSLAPYR